MKHYAIILLGAVSFAITSCGSGSAGKDSVCASDIITTEMNERDSNYELVNKEYPKESFAYFLQHFPRKKGVHYWNGKVKSHDGTSLDIDVSELQQCADAVIRLHAEWLWSQKRYNDIHYNLTNGFMMDYPKWAEGWRVKVNGNNTQWYRAKDTADYSYENFRDYLEFVFTYAGTASLDKELIPAEGEMQPGDVFILPGHPGHAVILLDIKYYKTGVTSLWLAQSWMPAQEIELVVGQSEHALKEPNPDYHTGMASFELKNFNNGKCPLGISGYEFYRNNVKRFKTN